MANPKAAILSGAMMLDFLGESEAAASIERACADPSTDVDGTTAIGDAVAALVSQADRRHKT